MTLWLSSLSSTIGWALSIENASIIYKFSENKINYSAFQDAPQNSTKKLYLHGKSVGIFVLLLNYGNIKLPDHIPSDRFWALRIILARDC